MTDLKNDLVAELKALLLEWNALGTHPAATNRDYVRIRAKIAYICNLLDGLDGKANV